MFKLLVWYWSNWWKLVMIFPIWLLWFSLKQASFSVLRIKFLLWKVGHIEKNWIDLAWKPITCGSLILNERNSIESIASWFFHETFSFSGFYQVCISQVIRQWLKGLLSKQKDTESYFLFFSKIFELVCV